MAWAQNAVPTYPLRPHGYKVSLGTPSAKTTFADLTNAVKLIDQDPNFIRSIGLIYCVATVTLVAGKLLLLMNDGTNTWMVDELVFTAATISTTANPAGAGGDGKLIFPKWTPAAPLILPEAHHLYIGVTTAQSANALVAHAQQVKVF